jgi:hypothetical protein
MIRHLVPLAVLAAAASCGDTSDRACVAGTAQGCASGRVCEVVAGEPACVGPVVIAGRVLDSASGLGVAGARVVAIDANGSVGSASVATGADGSFRLQVPAARGADKAPIAGQKVTIRSDAAGYQTFPTPPRVALPFDLTEAALDKASGAWVVSNAATEVRLVALGPGQRYTVSGTVEKGRGGVLVVADQGAAAVSTALTDPDGAFRLFNVPAGATTVSAFAAGLGAGPVPVTVDADVSGVNLPASSSDLAVVSGSVNIVNAPGGSVTSVILAVESTFQAATACGIAPAGLRVASVANAFSIADVPPGRYVALAAFENDGLVRDPDTGIGGTAIVHVEVVAGKPSVDLGQSFKVTGALAVKSPGAETMEVVSAAEPVFEWADDSSEDGYELEVFDAYGDRVYSDTAVPGVSGSATVTAKWAGAQPKEGMIFQFRARSYRESKKDKERRYISATEDLRGVFLWKAAGGK